MHSSSIISSIERQDKSIYKQNTEPHFTVDDAFRDSWALNVPTQAPRNENSTEDEDTVASVMDVLEQLAHDGDLCSALHQMEVDSTELKDWENAILRMTKDRNGNDTSFSLNEILTNDIFSYVEDALCKENNKSSMAQPNPRLSVKPETFGEHFSAVRDFPNHSHAKARVEASNVKPEMKLADQEMIAEGLGYNGLKGTMGISIGPVSSTQSKDVGIFIDNRKDSHCQNCGFKLGSHQVTTSTQLNSLSSGWEHHLVGSVGDTSPPINNFPNPFQYQKQPTGSHWNEMLLGSENQSDSLSPSKSYESSVMNSSSSVNGAFPQQISPQLCQNTVLCSSPVKNRFESFGYYQMMSDHLSKSSQKYSDDCNDLANSVYHSYPSSLATDQCSPLSSCMFESHSPHSTNKDQNHPPAQAVTISACGKHTIPANQSPPEAACYFHWLQNEPVVGSSSVPQPNASSSASSGQIEPGVESHSALQRYLSCSGHIQVMENM